MSDIPFPIKLFQDIPIEEDCWPALCRLTIDDHTCTDQDLAKMLGLLPSRRLTSFTWDSEGIVPSLTYHCLREKYLGTCEN